MHLILISRRLIALCCIILNALNLVSSSRIVKSAEALESKDEKISGRNLLEACDTSLQCSYKNTNSYCTDGQCFCAPHYVMLVKDEELRCFETAKISEKCTYNEQCQSANTKTVCVAGRCQCKASYKNHPECKLDHKLLAKQISMSYLINIVMATVVGVIILLFLLCIVCFKCQKQREANHVIVRMNNQNRQSVMSSNDVDKPPSYDEIFIGTPTMAVESPTILRPPSYNQIFVYGEVAVPGNYPVNVEEDFPNRH